MKSAPKEIREFCNWGHNQAWECFLRMRDGSPESWDWAGITVTWWRWGGDHAQEREEQTPSPGRSSVHTDPSRESWAGTLQMCTVFFFWLHWVFAVICKLPTVVVYLVVEHRLYLGHVGLGVVAQGLNFHMACGVFPNQELNSCPLHCKADS